MKITTHSKSSMVGWVDQVTGLGLKIGLPLFIVSLAYLVMSALGSHIRELPQMKPADRDYFIQSVGTAITVMKVSSIVTVAALAVRLFAEEFLGHILAVLGALLYFGSAAFFGYFVDASTLVRASGELFASIVQEIRFLGAVCLLPGLSLILKDAILRIWIGTSVKRIEESRWGDEEERARKHGKPKLYARCWDMPFCRDFVRRVCPAWQARKSCWRVKVGCYCDEGTILKAMTSCGGDNEHVRGIVHSLGLNGLGKRKFTAKQRRARCRRCGIYSEHQRQKYRILSPLVFPAVGAGLFFFYDQIAAQMARILQATDRFMSFLTLRDAHYTFARDQQILTVIAMVWLTIVVVSYALKGLEYLIFELQV